MNTLKVLIAAEAVFAAGLGIELGTRKARRAQTFQYEDRKVIRVYVPLINDRIFVETEPNSGKYISLYKHIENIPNERDQRIEQTKIKKIVGW